MDITPLHTVTDWDKAKRIARSMEEDGWTGYPILVIGCDSCGDAITGTHRLWAAQKAGIEPEVHVIDCEIVGAEDYNEEWAELVCDMVECGDDADRLALVEQAHALGLVDDYALEIMTAEFNKSLSS